MKKNRLLLIVAFVYLSINLVNLITQEFRLQKYYALLEQDLMLAQKEQETLKVSLKYYDTQQGVEKLARERLGYYKKNEIPVRVIEASTISKQATFPSEP